MDGSPLHHPPPHGLGGDQRFDAEQVKPCLPAAATAFAFAFHPIRVCRQSIPGSVVLRNPLEGLLVVSEGEGKGVSGGCWRGAARSPGSPGGELPVPTKVSGRPPVHAPPCATFLGLKPEPGHGLARCCALLSAKCQYTAGAQWMLAVPMVRAFLPPACVLLPTNPESRRLSGCAAHLPQGWGGALQAPDSVPLALVSGFGLYLFLLLVQETLTKS